METTVEVNVHVDSRQLCVETVRQYHMLFHHRCVTVTASQRPGTSNEKFS